MQNNIKLTTYIKSELALVYPILPIPESATRSQRVMIFVKQDVIAYFAPIRLLWRGLKTFAKTIHFKQS